MDGLASAPLKWRFDRCVFEESTLELSVDGVLVELERKPMEVLRHLLRHAGEVVTKEEIHAAVWPGRVLSDTVLTKAVSRIREVLRDDAQAMVKTVHGYGYRLIAPVRIEAAAAAPMPMLGLKAGDSPPLRAQWQLLQHLGSGGSGEVWRVAHRKSGEVRVYKFALDADALLALKREITLFRVLRQQLGPEARLAEILDWNLDEAPYFIELEYYAAGNLALWAAAQNGLAQIALPQRLAVFADCAEAVARVHSVGVLHKDLKASNILVRLQGAAVQPLLADFGGGGVLTEDVLTSAGITRMGFTQLLNPAGQATQLYLPPEVMEGQPQTIRGDIYALGVLLYQMCAGDFRKPISPGWELSIDDELLRADIAEAVQGDPERRLSSAQVLADRIRSLPERHQLLAAERRQQQQQAAMLQEAALARQKIEQLRARRTGLNVAFVVLLVGLGASLLMYRQAVAAREAAEHAQEVAQSVSNFLNYDILAATEAEGRDARSLTAQQLLDDAAKRIDARFVDLPEAGAKVHTAFSSSYMQIGDTAAAFFHRERGWDIAKQLQHSDPEASLRLAVDLSPVDYTRDVDAAYWLAMRDVAIKRWGANDNRTLLLRNAVALVQSRQRLASEAAESYTGIIRDAADVPQYDVETLATHWEDLGQELAQLARFDEAEAAYRKAIAMYEGLYQPGSFSAVTAQLRYARMLITKGRFDEAEALIDVSLKAGRAQRNSQNALVITAQRTQAILRIEQNRTVEAETILAEVIKADTASRGARSQQVVHGGYLLALLHERQGQFSEATQLIREALDAQQQVPVALLYGEKRKSAERVRYQLLLVRTLAAQGLAREARAAFDGIGRSALTASWLSELDQVEALETQAALLRSEGRPAQASSDLRKAEGISSRLLGAQHAQTRRLQAAADQLAAAPANAAITPARSRN